VNAGEYVAHARQAILDLLDEKLAVVPGPELEAWLSDRPYTPPTGRPLRDGFNPHHLTTAKNQLLHEGLILAVSGKTRGGRTITVLVPAIQTERTTDILRSAARKRLLHTRYISWTRATDKLPNMIGEGGERTARASLAAAAFVGYRLLHPATAEATTLFGSAVPGGPLDAAAQIVVDDPNALPVPITVLIEVKNIRDWIYPDAAELYQLLDKAARLQLAHPAQRLLPVLICRRAQYLTRLMAADLGFFVITTTSQAILPHSEVDEKAVEEVNQELNYNLLRSSEPHPFLVSQFTVTIPREAFHVATRWAQTAPHLARHFGPLRDSGLGRIQRHAALDALHRSAIAIQGVKGHWRSDTDNESVLPL